VRDKRKMSNGRSSLASIHEPRSLHALILLVGFLLPGCEQQMADQPRYDPLEASDFFADGRASRPRIPGTVAQGQPNEADMLYSGKVDGKAALSLPFPVTYAVLARGRERYNIFCAPCHDRVGNGQGMIVRRGFKRPASFHSDRLRLAPVGYFFDVITNGFGVMSSYASQVPPRDRWSIVAYVRALQLSQHAALEDVPPSERAKLLEGESGASR